MHPTVRNARVAGVFYLINAVTGGFYIMIVPSTLIVQGNATATANNILASEMLFRVGIVSELISGVAFVFVAMAMYRLFNGVDKTQASLLVVLVLIAVPIMFLNALNNLAALDLLSGASFLSVFQKPQLEAQAMLFLELHQQGVIVVAIFWGLWLFPFGVLVMRSGFIPRILGVLLIPAGFAYVATSLVYLLLPPYVNVVSLIAALLEGLGEVPIMAWLLTKGARVQGLAAHAP